MAYNEHSISEDIIGHWNQVFQYWDADAKVQYYKKILQQMIELSDELYDNNYRLEQFAIACVNRINNYS